ncbi:MAG: helix-turn-helix transcriptional regulator [Pleurocapsa sp. SU_5_0]|nr:helix-turn-helix transcriptional regulator [Pleurocapsa sp. SU_5_0]NJO95993.1 helix-turn-helix transcriptional regulator [Pleurocapsa sp. CRU_1_2]NJR46264.1 helix-turn-helix transcriptional regulator [Hyellaceae cyanobacterium CSU_1_1]
MNQISPQVLSRVAEYFKILSETSRLQILCSLKSGSKNVSEIMEVTNLGQANVSKHLRVLTQAGMLERQPKGVSVFYEIVDPTIFELCDLVCDRLIGQLQTDSAKLEQLKAFHSKT